MDAFISYRRNGGIEIARNIWNELRRMNYHSFFDIDNIQEGVFPDQIYRSILHSNNFIIVLTKGALDRCLQSEKDWVRRELSTALRENKNIIPISCDGFSFPPELPEDIDSLRFFQLIYYNGLDFDEMIKQVIRRLKDENGDSLRIKKKKNISNTFYEDGNMSDEEKKRIRADYQSCQKVESSIFDRLLAGKKDIVLFNPAIYEIDSYMDKYNRPEIGRVFGLLNHQTDADEATNKYASRGHQQNAFYVGNMEHDTFEDEMDRILSEHGIRSFDFVDLTLILRDVVEPEKKLRQVAERVSPGGIIYVRELDHGMALAYPDDGDMFKHMLSLIENDDFSGDFEAGRKVYFWMRNADLTDIHFEEKQISTVGMKRREKRRLFETLFSYVEREYRVMYEKEPSTEASRALDWLKENYATLEARFTSDDFFYSSGFMEFYGTVE